MSEAATTTNAHQARWQQTLRHVRARVETVPGYRTSGRVLRATGMVIEAVGLRVALGNACRIELLSPGGSEPPRFAEAEVVGFNGERLLLMPLTEIAGLMPGARVFPLGDGPDHAARRFPLGESLLGRVVDGNGEPLDGLGPLDDAPVLHCPHPRSTL